MYAIIFGLIVESSLALSLGEESTCSRDGDCGDTIDKFDEHHLVELLFDQANTYSTDLEDLKKLLRIKDRLISIQRKNKDYLPRRKSYEEAVEQINKFGNEKLEANGIAAETVEEIGLGLFATKDIKSGEKVIKIPTDAVLSSLQSIKRFECMGTIKMDKPKYPLLWQHINLSLIILAEAYNDSSAFRTYINVLPSRLTHPIFFAYEDFEALSNASIVYKAAAYTFYETMAIYAKIWLKLWETNGCPEKIGFDMSKFTVKAFQWAYTITVTRYYDGRFHEGEVNDVLIPFWDLANHHAAKTVRTEPKIGNMSAQSSSAYLTYAVRDIKKGEEIFMGYSPSVSPIQAFTTWGFVDVKVYYLTIELDQNDSDYLKMKSQLEKADNLRNGLALPDPSNEGERDYKNTGVNTKGILGLLPIANGHPDVDYTPKNIAKAWRFLQNQLDRRIARYDASISELREKLQTAKTNNMKLIYSELIAELEILNRLLKYVEHVLDN